MRLFLRSLSLPLALFVAQHAAADQDTFQVSLGGSNLGRIAHEVSGGTRDLTLFLDSTPFGVFDGSYAGRTMTSGAVARHSGRTRSSRKSRDLSMTTEGGQLREVSIEPETERTALTTPQAVTSPVLDPVSAFGRLLEVSACPNGLRIYDGRRMGLLSLVEERREAQRATCRIGYRVLEGPGYLEPLGISRISVELTYDVTAPVWHLMQIDAYSGPFGISLSRKGS